jgi:hypothetical protein
MPTFIKVPQGHQFKKDEKIRLGGLIGKIIEVREGDDVIHHFVEWEARSRLVQWLNISIFPDLEIVVEEPKISREAAEELQRWIAVSKVPYRDSRGGYVIHQTELEDKLDSMIEEEK